MKASNLILIPQCFGCLIYNRQSCRYSAFDTDCNNLFVNSKSLPAQVNIGSLEDKQKKEASFRFLQAYKDRGYFNEDGVFCGSILPIDPVPDHLTGPLTVHLEVTANCNLNCVHCFASESNDNDLLSLKEIDPLFRELASLGSFRLGLTGGEPLMRNDILNIIDSSLHHGLQPCMTTNGLLITEYLAKEFGKRRFGWFNISLDGSTPESHDKIRGKGTFNEVLTKIKIVRKHIPFSLAFTVMKHNLHEMETFCELAESLGAQAAVFRPLYPVGNASGHDELMPEFNEYIASLERLKGSDFNFKTEMCSFHAWGPGTRHDRHAVVYDNFGCGAGNTTCSISSNGDVSPCSFLGEGYIAGNLRNNPLKWIWDNSSVFREIRNLPGNDHCESCSEYDLCSGGCRARALMINKSINAIDPWCNAKRQNSNNQSVQNLAKGYQADDRH